MMAGMVDFRSGRLGASRWTGGRFGPRRAGVPPPPDPIEGAAYLRDPDEAYLRDPDGAYLIEDE